MLGLKEFSSRPPTGSQEVLLDTTILHFIHTLAIVLAINAASLTMSLILRSFMVLASS